MIALPQLDLKFPVGGIVIASGCMFSGKTEELIKFFNAAAEAGLKTRAIKHAVDTRDAEDVIVSHSGQRIHATLVPNVLMMEKDAGDELITLVDEGQFFGDDLIRFAEAQRSRGRLIVISGLATDFRGAPFGCMPHLMAIADLLIPKYARCTVCRDRASYSQRVVNTDAVFLVGGKDSYEPRCRLHWDPNKFE